MSEKYSTDELVKIIKNGMLFIEGSKAMIAKADKLCEAAKGLLDFIQAKFPGDFEQGGPGFTCPHHEAIRKAIADYGEEK